MPSTAAPYMPNAVEIGSVRWHHARRRSASVFDLARLLPRRATAYGDSRDFQLASEQGRLHTWTGLFMQTVHSAPRSTAVGSSCCPCTKSCIVIPAMVHSGLKKG